MTEWQRKSAHTRSQTDTNALNLNRMHCIQPWHSSVAWLLRTRKMKEKNWRASDVNAKNKNICWRRWSLCAKANWFADLIRHLWLEPKLVVLFSVRCRFSLLRALTSFCCSINLMSSTSCDLHEEYRTTLRGMKATLDMRAYLCCVLYFVWHALQRIAKCWIRVAAIEQTIFQCLFFLIR